MTKEKMDPEHFKQDQLDQWSGLKAAERAAALAQHMAEGRLVRSNVQNLQDAHREKLGLGPASEEEEMGIQVGDNVTNIHQAPQPVAQPGSQKDDFLKKAVLYGGLVAAGAGTPWLVSKLTSQPEPAPQQKEVIPSKGPDADTQYELRISSGDE